MSSARVGKWSPQPPNLQALEKKEAAAMPVMVLHRDPPAVPALPGPAAAGRGEAGAGGNGTERERDGEREREGGGGEEEVAAAAAASGAAEGRDGLGGGR